ncbi:MAG: VWA domain-containing protein [Candidatus Lokiarchaeota archaeon]|nr:VWA domain-containing protein [Candidatus Lokiarchaeota archaeon]
MQLVDAGNTGGQAMLNRQDMDALHLEEFDVVVLVAGGIVKAAVHVTSSEECHPGTVLVDEAVVASLAPGGSQSVDVKKIVPRGGIAELRISVDPQGKCPIETAIVWVSEHAGGIQKLLKRRPVFKGMELEWKDAEVCPLRLKVIDTKPPIGDGDVAVVDSSGMEILFDLVPAAEMGFNTILCIDVSGSMLNADYVVQDVSSIIDFLKQEYAMASLDEFLSQFQEGAAVSRIASAAAASLLYLSLKAKRGLGENVQVVAFGDDVEVLEMENAEGAMSPVIECSGQLRDLNLNTLAYYITDKTKKAVGLTAMSVALKIAAEQIAHFPTNPRTGKPDPTMVILLSDGNPNKGDEATGIPVNPIPVAREFLAKEGVVIYTIGLGEADDLLMEKLGRDVGRGDYLKATNLLQLWRFYDDLASKFSISIRSEREVPPGGIVTPSIAGPAPAAPEPEHGPEEMSQPEESGGAPIAVTKAKTPAGSAGTQIASKTPVTKSETIKVFFQATIGPGEKQIELEIDKNTRIENLKVTVGNIFGLFPPDFHLVYGGITMDETRAIKVYHVDNGDTILIVPASTAGGISIAS